jgi:xylulokinase
MSRRSSSEVLIAVDVGTSGARAAGFDLDGSRLLEVRRSYPTSIPRPGWAEQDAAQWRSASLAALGELVRQLGPRSRVLAIGLTGQCPSVVVLDAAQRPLRPGLIYRDNRATTEAASIRHAFGEAAFHLRTGHLPAPFHIAPKLMWLRANEPQVWGRAALALQPRDWVALALTGEIATDGTHAAATLAFGLRERRWDLEILDKLQLAPGLFPPVRSSSAVVGRLRRSVGQRLGLRAATPVVMGGADSQACALGAAVVTPGPVSEMAGSSTCLNAAVPKPLAVLQVTHYPHVVPGIYSTETGINTTGEAVRWLADLLYGGRRGRARHEDFVRLDHDVSRVPPLSDGVLALPVLGDGERTDPELRGAFLGMSLRHDRGALARSVLEGVAFAIRDQLDLLRRGGAAVTELRISGGDARLGTWNRIKADITGVPVRTVPGDAAVTGVAMLAGIGAGVYRDANEAIARCVRLDPPIEPDPTTCEIYESGYAAWHSLADSRVVRQAQLA